MNWRITWLALAILLVGCIGLNTTPTISSPVAEEPTWTPDPTQEDKWPEFIQHTPIPWATPLPANEETVLDGIYIKNDPSERMWWNCARCPDYRPAGGIWRLQFDKGVFRIYYTVTGWRSLGSVTIKGDRLYLFNDPFCRFDVGEYTWQLENGKLKLTEVDDICPANLPMRSTNLTKQDWLACTTAGGEGTPPPECESAQP